VCRKTSTIWVLLLVCLLIHGCAALRFPEAPVKRVRGFSLGTCQIEDLGKNPTANEVYEAVVRLFDSLDTAAATCRVEEIMTKEWAQAYDRPLELAGKQIKARVDFRYARPNKMLIKRSGDEPLVTLQNGTVTIIFRPEDMTYRRIVTPKELVEAVPPSVTGWLQLLPGNRQVDKMRLGKSSVDGTQTYTLELSFPYEQTESGYVPAEDRTFYFGRKDLLPRKMEIIRRVKGTDGGFVVVDRVTITFLGFRANEKLSPMLFSTKLPKGAAESSD